MSNQLIPKDFLKELYSPQDPLIIYLIPVIIVFIVIIIVIYYLVLIDLNLSKNNWETNKCIPKYMFLSGFIQKEENEGVLGTIHKTFKKCVNKYYTKTID